MRLWKSKPWEGRRLLARKFRLRLCLLILVLGILHCAAAAKSASSKSPSEKQNSSSAPKAKKPAPKGSCLSQGGRFPPFPRHGKRPSKSPKGKADDLSFCRVYKDSTCCGRVNSDTALLSLRMLQIGAEPSDECAEKWEALECAMCHPAIGTQPGPPAICSSFCDSLFDACKSAFFATDPIANVFMPCSPRDTLCSRGSEWATTGIGFCKLAGYDVVNETAFQPVARFCFDGTLGVLGDGRSGKSGASQHGAGSGSTGSDDSEHWWEQWFGEDGGAFLGGNIRWAIAGLVLTAAAILWRWRTMRSRKKRAAILASKQLLEARSRLQAIYDTNAKRTTSSNGSKAKKK